MKRLALVSLVVVALAGCGGDSPGLDPEASLRQMIEKRMVEAGASATIGDITCVDEAENRWTCAVSVTEADGTEENVAGTLICQGDDAGDPCIWRGQLAGG